MPLSKDMDNPPDCTIIILVISMLRVKSTNMGKLKAFLFISQQLVKYEAYHNIN
jgi:hypothetical protein